MDKFDIKSFNHPDYDGGERDFQTNRVLLCAKRDVNAKASFLFIIKH